MVARFRQIKAGPELFPEKFLSRDGTAAAWCKPQRGPPCFPKGNKGDWYSIYLSGLMVCIFILDMFLFSGKLFIFLKIF
jgi:hypothetical protein